MTNRRTTVTLGMAMLAAGCANVPVDYRAQDDGELLRAAMHDLTSVIVYDIFSPPQASRAYAYASIAAYEALRHEHSGYRSLAQQLNGLTPVRAPEASHGYFLPLSSVHAFMTVGRALTFSQERMDSLRSAMHDRFRNMSVPRDVFDRSVAYGDTVAQHVLAWAAQDRFIQSRGFPKYTVLPEPGRWVPTPPAYMDAVEPSWAMLRPFALDSASQFRPPPPVPFDMTEGSAFRREVMEVFDIGSSLSEDQRAIAAFWDCNPYVMHVRGHAMFATKKITPGGHWMGIATIASRKAGADLMSTAEAYALTAIALADGFIASWDEKYRSNVIRPETVINAHLDEQWQPLLQTPPFPEYTSGHSVISTAAARVLTSLFGDGFAFADSTEMEYGLPVRAFSSFEQAAEEAAISRLYAGIHYRMAIEAGITQGRSVGDHVVARVSTRPFGSTAQSAGASR
jgi:hypothetical protein